MIENLFDVGKTGNPIITFVLVASMLIVSVSTLVSSKLYRVFDGMGTQLSLASVFFCFSTRTGGFSNATSSHREFASDKYYWRSCGEDSRRCEILGPHTVCDSLLLDRKKTNRMGQIWIFCISLVECSCPVPGLHYASQLNFPKGMVFILLEGVRKTRINNGSLGK